MIKVTAMDKRIIAINSDMIERIENIPETIITLNNGKKIIVLDTMDEVIEKVKDYKRDCFPLEFSGKYSKDQ